VRAILRGGLLQMETFEILRETSLINGEVGDF